MKLSVQPEGTCPTRKARYTSEEAMWRLIDEARTIAESIGVTQPVNQAVVPCGVCDGFHFDRPRRFKRDSLEGLRKDIVDPDDEDPNTQGE